MTGFRDFGGGHGLFRRAVRHCLNKRMYPQAADLKQHGQKALSSSRCLYRTAFVPINTHAFHRPFITLRSLGEVGMTRRRNKPQNPGEVDRHRIIDRLEATVRHPRREPESAAWGVSPIDSYLRDRLDSPGSVTDR